MSVQHKIHIFCTFLCLTLVLLLYKYVSLDSVSILTRFTGAGRVRKTLVNRTVLLWHRPWAENFNIAGDICWDLFEIPRCKLVDDHANYSTADVVVFHHEELRTNQVKLPFDLPRPKGQRWAWMTIESPDWNGDLKRFGNIFNMTITYRRDSDVYAPYGELQAKEDDEQPVEDVPSNKTFFACWVVSHYNKRHARLKVYDELKKYIPIQVYGRWVGNQLPMKELISTIQKCNFYLAFENANYKDYITEKLWRNAFISRVIPVVFGAPLEDYKAVAPPHSFIHVDEFATLKALADYLKELAVDKKRYNEYFTWRRNWKIISYPDLRNGLCKVCKVFDSLPAHKIYSDLDAWALDKDT